MVYAAHRAGQWNLWAAPVEGGRLTGDPVQVADDVGQIRSLALSRDGRFVHVQLGNTSDIYCSALEPVSRRPVGEPDRVLAGRGPPNRAGAWAPDGTLFAYLTRRPLPGAPEAYRWRPALMDMGTGEEHVFRLEASAPRAFYVKPEWSPDASRLYFDFSSGVYALNLATAEHGYLVDSTSAPGARMYTFLGTDPDDGSFLYLTAADVMVEDYASYYQARSRVAVVRRDPRTGTDEELWGGLGHWHPWAASLSPDGRSVALVEDLSPSGALGEHVGSLSIVDLDTGGLREVVREPWFWGGYVWDVGGARVILAAFRMREASTVVRADGLTPVQETTFWLLDLGSGQLRQGGTVSFVTGQEGYGARQMSLHPSGSPLCYTMGGSIEDILVREGVRIPEPSP